MPRKKTEKVETKRGEPTIKLITAAKLKSLLSSAQKAKEDCSEITGSLGEEIRSAIENNHLHRPAFNAIKGMMGKSPEKLREFKDHFDFYWEASGLEKKADSAQRLPMGDDLGGEEEDDDAYSNVTGFPGRDAAE